MKTEIEAKFVGVDKNLIRERLRLIGASCVQSERLMRRKNFDYPDFRLEERGGWVRVRDEGIKITLSYKQLNDRTIEGTKELSVKVSDFEETVNLLQAIGLDNYSYQETLRESWELNGVEVEIDTWPWIPSFLEVEGETKEELVGVVEKLGLRMEDALFGSVEVVYQKYYNVTEKEIDNWPVMTLTEVPDWLEKKRIIVNDKKC